MVNFRYHVVSLVAVFLALALGIVMGTTVISENLVSQLRRDARDFALRSQQLRRDVTKLESGIGFHEQFAASLIPGLTKGKLAGKPVVLLIQDDAPGALIDRVAEALRLAGAARPARLRLPKAWALTGEADRGKLALATDAASNEPEPLSRHAAGTLATRLVGTGDPRADGDALKRLSEAGFLKLDDIPPGPFPAAGSLIVLVSSGAETAVPDAGAFFEPLLRAMAKRRPAVVVEPLEAVSSIVARVRDDGDVNDVVGTVDHADTIPGQLSIVWALKAAAESKPALHLGVDDKASGIAPPDLSAS